MGLALRGYIALPPHDAGGFDHGDVHLSSGHVFVAHTATGTVEIIDGRTDRHHGTITGCPEASGVLCAQEPPLVFAAARGAGHLLVIDAESAEVRGRLPVGPKPNGLAWDARRRCLLVADVQDLRARLVDPLAGRDLAGAALPGRPRWCVYDPVTDRFLVNIREPACVAVLAAGTLEQQALWTVPAAGPHGLDIDLAHRRAFVACDGGAVVALDADDGRVRASVPIANEPDAIWYDPGRSRLYVAIGDPGEIAVVDTESMTLAQEITTEPGAHTTAFDRERGRLYVFLPRSHRAAILDTA